MGRAVRKSLTRDRANLSFFIVIIFFAVFTAIVLTEIFLIDERGRGAAARNSRYPPSRLHHEYEDSAPGAQDALIQEIQKDI
ncbi:hypothetical protein J6590_042907 [Homalodisca vitripennis]|nr:hypothetical protein J6590_042907 [Homalodisca vitripennis]